jgi:pilus assembly protein CpaB
LLLADYPPASVPQGAFDAIERLAGPTEDRVILRAVEPNEPVLASKVSGLGGRAILSTVIDPKMRAVTISVNDVKGVAGLIQPGDRVDVMLTRNPAGNQATAQGQSNDILLQNVKVLGIDQQTDDKKDTPAIAKAVTLEVSPEDGQKLTLAGAIGSLSLSLRNFANPDAVETHSLSSNDLVAHAKADVTAEPQAAAPTHHKIEIIRGTTSTTYDLTKD